MSSRWKEMNVETTTNEYRKKKIHASARKVLCCKLFSFVWAGGNGREQICGRRNNSVEEKENPREE